MLSAMARIAPARPATRQTTKKIAGSEIFVFSTDIREADRAWLFQMGGRGAGRQAGRSAIFRFSPAAISAESPPPVV